jgi:hypothetical protein
MIGVGRGGGHGGYYGNDIFGLDLATRTWEEVTTDYTGGGSINTTYGEYSDGSPLGSHCGAWWFYNQRTKELGMVKSWNSSSGGSDASSVPWGHSINLETVLSQGYSPTLWRRHGQQTQHNGGLSQIAGSAYNLNDGLVYYECGHSSTSQSGIFASYNAATDSYTEYAQPWGSYTLATLHSSYAIDLERNVWAVGMFRSSGGISARPLDDPTKNRRTNAYGTINDDSWRAVEINAPTKPLGAGWMWSPVRNGFVMWGEGLGGTVYLAEYTGPATPNFPVGADTDYELTWKTISTLGNGVNPLNRSMNGTFDRFQLIAWGNTEVAFIINTVDGPVDAFLVAQGNTSSVRTVPKAPMAVGKADVSVFNINGRLVSKLKVNSQQLKAEVRSKTTGLAAGLYLLKIGIGKKIYTQKLLINP